MYYIHSHHRSSALTDLCPRTYLLAACAILFPAAMLLSSPVALAQDEPAWDAVFETAGMNGAVNALAFDAAGNLYAGGSFTEAGGQSASRVAMWDGTKWTALGTGVSGESDAAVHALATDASGRVYAAGLFTSAGGATTSNIAVWDGNTWSSLGAGVNDAVYALAVDENGDVYAGGNFTLAGDEPALRIAKWDGASWSTLGSGMNGSVYALALDDEGNVYTGGSFQHAGGTEVNRIAVWNGTTWGALGGGAKSSSIHAIAVRGQTVYAGGDFRVIGGISADRIARWDGTTWSALSTSGIYKVGALATSDDGKLYVGGTFTSIEGEPYQHIAIYDGETWSSLGSGVDDTVNALAVRYNSVFAGGSFTAAGETASQFIARWGTTVTSSPAEPAPIQPLASTEIVIPAQPFSVAIDVGSASAAVSNLFGAGFAFHFDPALFQATSAAPGAFIDDGDVIFQETIDNETGTVYVSVTRKRGALGASGHGTIASIELTTVHEGASQPSAFSLSDVLAVDPGGIELPLTILPGGVHINTLTVWPGDTDNDGDADISDVLPVGIYFGLSGPARPAASFTWEAQAAQAWDTEPAMYADATGDGTINQNDILPIGVNFGLNRDASPGAPALRAAARPLATLPIPALSEGEQFSATLSLTAQGTDLDNLLGYAASFSLPASLEVVASSSGALLDDGDLLELTQSHGQRYYVAHTRKRQSGAVSGSGPVLELTIKAVAPVTGASSITLDALSLGTMQGVVAAGPDMPVSLTSSLGVSNDHDAPTEFELHGSYPNPFSSRATIRFDLPEAGHVTVTIYDMLGREAARIDAGTLPAGANHRMDIDGAGLSSGTYVYRLHAAMAQRSSMATGRFVVAR